MLFIATIVGIIFSGKHILIQAKWITVPAECGIDLDYMFENFPLSQAINLLFKGTGDCSTIDWNFFGITLPQLAFLGYLFIMVLAIITFLKIRQN
jgi:protein dithiol:quinone oxidoreductase